MKELLEMAELASRYQFRLKLRFSNPTTKRYLSDLSVVPNHWEPGPDEHNSSPRKEP